MDYGVLPAFTWPVALPTPSVLLTDSFKHPGLGLKVFRKSAECEAMHMARPRLWQGQRDCKPDRSQQGY